mmetsp:Transcript_52069/g.110659  ORF Transcript_52069/g.110659 Transcript_52069/m.110659 type:complete len:87 (-) Transcript_52069:67-327(-)
MSLFNIRSMPPAFKPFPITSETKHIDHSHMSKRSLHSTPLTNEFTPHHQNKTRAYSPGGKASAGITRRSKNPTSNEKIERSATRTK